MVWQARPPTRRPSVTHCSEHADLHVIGCWARRERVIALRSVRMAPRFGLRRPLTLSLITPFSSSSERQGNCGPPPLVFEIRRTASPCVRASCVPPPRSHPCVAAHRVGRDRRYHRGGRIAHLARREGGRVDAAGRQDPSASLQRSSSRFRFFMAGRRISPPGFDVTAAVPISDDARSEDAVCGSDVPAARAITPLRDLRALVELWRWFRAEQFE